jgi:hypothetical protein
LLLKQTNKQTKHYNRKNQQQLGVDGCSRNIKRKEKFLGHTSTFFYTKQEVYFLRNLAVGWSRREGLGNTSRAPLAILEQV